MLFFLFDLRAGHVSTGFRQAQPPARQPPAADDLDQPIRRQVEQAQVGERRRTGDGRAETEERETEDGGKANARSGASPIGRTSGPGNTVISYAPWDFWAVPASDGKRLHIHAQRLRATKPLPYWVCCEAVYHCNII